MEVAVAQAAEEAALVAEAVVLAEAELAVAGEILPALEVNFTTLCKF